jgi:hypothetical protein
MQLKDALPHENPTPEGHLLFPLVDSLDTPSQYWLSPSSNVPGLTYPGCGGATKLANASVTSAILIKKSSCPSLGSTYISSSPA